MDYCSFIGDARYTFKINVAHGILMKAVIEMYCEAPLKTSGRCYQQRLIFEHSG